MTSDNQEGSAQEYIRQLLRPERAKSRDVLSIIAFSEISDHHLVADIGCGPGFFTIPLAKALRNGRLYALDIDDEMLAACRERVLEARLGNVEFGKYQEFQFPLEEGSLNGAFLAYVVHASSDKPRFLEAFGRLLRPRGWCTVLEWRPKETAEGPPVERRVDPAELWEMAEKPGFQFRNSRNLNDAQYMMALRKP